VLSVPSITLYAAKPAPIPVHPAGHTGDRELATEVSAIITLPTTRDAGKFNVIVVPDAVTAVPMLTNDG
jgi:hypothetical protein